MLEWCPTSSSIPLVLIRSIANALLLPVLAGDVHADRVLYESSHNGRHSFQTAQQLQGHQTIKRCWWLTARITMSLIRCAPHSRRANKRRGQRVMLCGHTFSQSRPAHMTFGGHQTLLEIWILGRDKKNSRPLSPPSVCLSTRFTSIPFSATLRPTGLPDQQGSSPVSPGVRSLEAPPLHRCPCSGRYRKDRLHFSIFQANHFWGAASPARRGGRKGM